MEKVATDNIKNESPQPSESAAPATAQHISALVQITSLGEAAKLLELPDGYEIEDMRKSFETLIHRAIKQRRTHLLKPLTDAKNIIQRHDIEFQISRDGSFDPGFIPYQDICEDCKGAGEIYRFFRDTTVETCKICNGTRKVLITCRQCNGSKKYTKHAQEVSNKEGDIVVQNTCPSCTVDEEGNPIGKEAVKCWKCKGTGKFRRYILAPKIKSTTHCAICKGRGFKLPDPPKKTPQKPDNPVINSDIAVKIKTANVEE